MVNNVWRTMKGHIKFCTYLLLHCFGIQGLHWRIDFPDRGSSLPQMPLNEFSGICFGSFWRTHLQGQPTESEGQHWCHKQRESPLPLLVPALLAVRWLPRYWIAFQADSNGTVGYADWQQGDHVGGYENEAGIEQSQIATTRPEFLAHY